jgi:integrase
VAELADAGGLNPPSSRGEYGFKSRPGHLLPGTEHQTWSSDELRTFLDAARDDRLYAAFVLLMTTGMRRGEVLRLRWFDVDFDDSSLSVSNTWTTTAKGYRVSGSPKTVKSRRQVYLDPATVDALRSHHARQNEERLAPGPAWDTDCKYVFTDELGVRFNPGDVLEAVSMPVRSSSRR